jgi:hypothetical protein
VKPYYDSPSGAICGDGLRQMRLIQGRRPGVRPGRALNDSQIVAMGKLRLKGFSVQRIAKETGVWPYTVSKWMRRLNLAPVPRIGCTCGECKRCAFRVYWATWYAANKAEQNLKRRERRRARQAVMPVLT